MKICGIFLFSLSLSYDEVMSEVCTSFAVVFFHPSAVFIRMLLRLKWMELKMSGT